MGMGVTGLLQSLGGGSDAEIYGTKPIVPELKDSQQSAIEANLFNLPQAEKLASGVNQFNYDELHKMLVAAIPGYEDILNQQSSLLQSQLRGELPQDVQNAIQRNSAVKSLYGGFGGSGAARNLTARDLGLTSLDLTGRALDSASRWMASTKQLSVPDQFNVASMFITPEQQFSRDWLKAKVDSAPDPRARGAFDTEMGFIGEVLSAYGGGAGYQGTYRPTYDSGGSGVGGGGGWYVNNNGGYSQNQNQPAAYSQAAYGPSTGGGGGGIDDGSGGGGVGAFSIF